MPDRSSIEDKALALGLIALGAALPLYELASARIRVVVKTLGDRLPLPR